MEDMKLEALKRFCDEQHIVLWAEDGMVCVGDRDPNSSNCGSFTAQQHIGE